MPVLQVRRATAADSDAIADLLTQLGYPTGSADVPGRLEGVASDRRAVVLLAQSGDDVVGLATLHTFPVLNRPRHVAWLTALVVAETARRSGVGSALVAAVEDLARQSGCERLSVTTHLRRADAHAFYRRAGFEETGRRFGKVLEP
jgi:N-acetylglutamate synthase-like GNAT family acetyltransferase